MGEYRVLYRNAGNVGLFEEMEADSREDAAWKVAMGTDSQSSILIEVQVLDEDGEATA